MMSIKVARFLQYIWTGILMLLNPTHMRAHMRVAPTEHPVSNRELQHMVVQVWRTHQCGKAQAGSVGLAGDLASLP